MAGIGRGVAECENGIFRCLGHRGNGTEAVPYDENFKWCDSPEFDGRFGGYCGTVITVPYMGIG